MFTETFLPHSNGVTTSLLNARAGLQSRGHNVTVYSAGPPVIEAQDVHFYGGKIFHLYPDFPIAFYPSRRTIRNNRRVRREGADVVHVHGPGPMGWRGYKASRKLKAPLVLTHHTVVEPLVRYAPLGWKTIYRLGTRFISRRLVNKSSLVIAPSTATQQELVDKYPGAAERIRVVPTGIDTQRFNPSLDGAPLREAWGIGEDERVILYVGRLSYEKRVDLVLETFARLRKKEANLRLIVAGTGPASSDLHRQAAQLKLKKPVLFTGHVPDQQLPFAYAAADAFASASVVETQGITLLEAMAVGKPVAVTAHGGYLDFVEDGENGFLFARDDAKAAAKALRSALDAPERVRTNARRTAERYSTQACIPLLESVYEETLDA